MQSLLLILTTRRYFAPAWVFASLNIIMGTWVLYIPMVKEKLSIDDGALGIGLFTFSVGALCMIPISSVIIKQVRLGRTVFLAITAFAFSMLLPVVAPTYPIFCGVMFLVGTLSSLTDISMNALVAEIEKEDDGHFMSATHGFFSLGGVLGAGIGSLMIYLFAFPVQHLLVAALFVLITNLLLFSSYWNIDGKAADREGGKFNFSLIVPLLSLTVLSLLVMGSEGAIEHWSKLFMLDIVQIDSEKLAGFGFVAFSTTMTIGRFLGDGVSKRFGSLKIIMGGTLIASIGFVAVLSINYTLALIGFGLVGLGFSVIIPELFRLAGRAKGVSSAEGIAVVAGMGYVGFLASPALLGFLSDLSSLKLSFIALLVASLSAFLIAAYLKFKQN